MGTGTTLSKVCSEDHFHNLLTSEMLPGGITTNMVKEHVAGSGLVSRFNRKVFNVMPFCATD